MDKNQAIIDYLIECPNVQANPLFFNFGKQSDNNHQIVTKGDDTILNKPYIDGSVMKKYTFTMFIYKSVSYNPVVKIAGYTDENVSDLNDVQALLDWVTEQNDLKHFPNFGNMCIIDSIETTTNSPVLNGVDDSVQPPLAQYSIGIRITYLDQTKMIWQ